MPPMDMSDAFDGDLCDAFDVKRRVEAVATATGRASSTDQTFPGIAGVVTMAHGNQLQRLEEADRMVRNISVVTQFMLRGPSKNSAGAKFKPDVVRWRGNDYVVKVLDPYPQFGPGFWEAICGQVEILETVDG